MPESQQTLDERPANQPGASDALAARDPDAPYRSIVEALPVPVLLQGADFRIVSVNRAFRELFGYTLDELSGLDVLALHHPDDRPATLAMRRALGEGEVPPREIERRAVARDGTVLRLRVQTQGIEHGGEKMLLCVVQDVEEEQRRAQIRLDRVELFRVFFEDSPVPTTVQDAQFRIVHANPAYCEWTGYALDELTGIDPIGLHDPAIRAEMLQFRELMRRGEVSGGCPEYRELRHRNGRRLRYRFQFREVTDASARRYYVAVMIDVTREARAQALLRRQTDRFIQAFEDAPVGMLVRDVAETVIRVNQAFTRLTGFDAESIVGQPFRLESSDPRNDWVDPAPGEDGVDHRRFSLGHRGGREIWVDAVSRRIHDFGGDPVVLTVIKDVSREQALHQELQDMVLQQAVLLRSMNAGLAHIVGNIVVQVNPVLPTMLGRSADRIVGQPYESLFGDDAFWRSVALEARSELDAGRAYRREVSMERADGNPRFFDMSLRRIDARRAGLGLIITLSDVTERHQQERRLQRALGDLEALIDNEAVGIAYLEAGRVARCNRRLERMLGLGCEALRGRELDGLFDLPADVASRVQTGAPMSLTTVCPARRADGRMLKCMVHVGPVDARRPGAAIVVAIDVSEREEALDRAETTQARFDAFASLINDAVFVVDLQERRALMANRCVSSLLGIPIDAFLRDPGAAWTNVPEDGRAALELAMQLAASGRRQELEVDVAHPGAGLRRMRVRMFCDDGRDRELFVLVEDVSEYRRLERQRLEDAVKQRDLLVREVHHRIKNNLQGVAGLLQQTASRRPEVAQALSEVASQIHAIAHIHGLQGRAGELLSLARMLRAICESLSSMFGMPIAVDTRGADDSPWGVPETEAVPLALVLNELITNALKHRQGDGGVGVRLSSSDERIELAITNPGRLPADFGFERHMPSPTGLGLVKALLPRRGTRIEYLNRPQAVEVRLALGHPALCRRPDAGQAGEPARSEARSTPLP